LGYWPSYYDYDYYPYGYSYPAYDVSPRVTVIYPQQAQAATRAVYVERARPVTREYDEFGQEVRPSGEAAASPIYLIAFKDGVIRAAGSYRVEARTLHYVTLQREPRETPLDDIDRELTLRLNRERRVPFQLPQ
jgi:hypothetical protein